MLAVQTAPRMASDKSPTEDPYLLFGYSVDPNPEPPMDPPPEPPSGAPLLTETDSKFLSSFFHDLTADQYNMPSFGEGLNFSDAWLDLPPQFMGTTTSFGQQAGNPMASSSSPGMSNEPMDFSTPVPASHMMPPPPPPQLQHHHQHQQQHQQQHHHHHQPQQHQQHPHHHSDDVLNAAATLLHNNQAARGGPPGSSDFTLPRRTMGPPVGHLRHQPLEEFQEEGRRVVAQNPQNPVFAADWMYAPRERRDTRPTQSTDVQWGSDANFDAAQCYTPDDNKETVESMHREQLKLLEGLEVSKSAASTRPSSPSNAQAPPPASQPRQQTTLPKGPEDPEAPPRKRRKSRINRESEEQDEGEETCPAKPIRRRKSKAERATESSPPTEGSSSGKKRRGTVNGAKQPRENLTEEQKRENHIRSEQKRRTLIKEGFDDLCELVPALRGGGFSKSTMLSIAAEWLEEMLRGNDALESQLATLEGSR